MRQGHIAGIGFAFLVVASHQGVAAHESFGEDFCELAPGTGEAVGADNMNYTRDITKFEPTVIVDRCMTDRGYRILSVDELGGG